MKLGLKQLAPDINLVALFSDQNKLSKNGCFDLSFDCFADSLSSTHEAGKKTRNSTFREVIHLFLEPQQIRNGL